MEFVDGCVTVATRRSSNLDRGLPFEGLGPHGIRRGTAMEKLSVCVANRRHSFITSAAQRRR